MATSVQPLLRALAVVPREAIPHTVDAFILVTSLSHQELLSSFISTVRQISAKDSYDDTDDISTHDGFWNAMMQAMLYSFKFVGDSEQLLLEIVWEVCIPLLQKPDFRVTGFTNIVVEMLVELIITKNAWEFSKAFLVPYLLNSVESLLGMKGDATTVYPLNNVNIECNVSSTSEELNWSCIKKPLKFHVASNLVAVLLWRASSSTCTTMSNGPCASSAEAFSVDVAKIFFHPTLMIISRSTDDADRECAIKILFPSLLKAMSNLYTSTSSGLLSSLQKELLEVFEKSFSQGSLQRQDIYFALDFSVKFLFLPNSQEQTNIWNDNVFWDIIRSGLVDDESLVRKRALHILKQALQESLISRKQGSISLEKLINRQSTKSSTRRDRYANIEARSLGVWQCEMERWNAFTLLYDMLEEYGTHLVEAAWNYQILLLLPTLHGKDIEVQPSNEISPHEGGCHLQQLDTTILWITVLWQRGFKHDNPQVRRLILQSFLQLEWSKIPNLASVIPESFVIGPLLSTFNDPIHHRDFGLKGIYSSKTATAAATFFRLYGSSLEIRDRMSFIIKMCNELSTRSSSRPGFMTSVMCLEAAASPQEHTLNVNDFVAAESLLSEAFHHDGANIDTSIDAELTASELLHRLGPLVEDSKKHFNPAYRLKVCYHLLHVAITLIVPSEVPFSKIYIFLGLFPHELVTRGGVLHGHIWCWAIRCFSATDFQSWMSNGLYEIAHSIIKPLGCGIEAIVTDEEVKAWVQETDKWARMVALGFLDKKSVSLLMTFVHEHISAIYKRAYNSTCIPEKLLLLLISILKVCSVSFLKNKGFDYVEKSTAKIINYRQVLGLTSCDGCTFNVLRENLEFIVSTNMDEIVAHAERASSIFWNYVFSSSHALPSSVTGRLGGPSQRRLSTKAVSDALKGVIAVEAIETCVVWSCQNNREISHCAHLFIWNFIWRSVNMKKPKEEMEGEMHLCIYEALAHTCNALAASLDPYVLSIVNQTVFPEIAKEEKILDIVICNLLDNTNSLMQASTLARSRKTFLLQQKWLCIHGLLSIPFSEVYATREPVNIDVPAVSYSVLKAILLDAINSLESAGEDNMLPLLRCLRWLMHWNVLQQDADDPTCKPEMMEVVWSLVKAAWAAVADCNKRRVASISAFLSAILHPNIFGSPTLHNSDGEIGPLKWLLLKLIDQGSRSPRTMRLTVMHATGLWLKYPAITGFYIEELYLLSLHGGENVDEELDGQISENLLACREYSMLMPSLDSELIEEFRNSELYARVSVAVLVDKFAQVIESGSFSEGQKREEDFIAAARFGKKMVLKFLHSLATDIDLSKELYKKKSAIHRKKIRAWQMACILSRFVDKDMLEEVMDLVHSCLLNNNLPSVRQYAEIFVIVICLRYPHLVREKIVPTLSEFNMKTQMLASYVFISVNILLHASPGPIQNMLIDLLLPAVIPYITTHHHQLRSFSQILIYETIYKISKVHCTSINDLSNNLEQSLEKKCIQSIVAFLEENNDCKRIRTAVGNFLTSFDPKTVTTPRGIFSLQFGGEDDLSKASDDIPFECVPVSLMDKVSYFLNEAREELRQSLAADAHTLESESISGAKQEKTSFTSNTEGLDGSANFQKKFGSLRFMDTFNAATDWIIPFNHDDAPVLSIIEKEQDLLHTRIYSRVEDIAKMRGNRQDLIVVATLLGRIPNLAGLARTCEVFKASSLVLADANVTQDRQFQLISVTAEMWIPIKEVTEENLQEYLTVMRNKGYTVVGLEQTAKSIQLQKYNFPKKTILVLGREKEGIPIEIIQDMDACLEIPQLGVIRSLNVHVSGAIAIWEYTRQNLEKLE